jgi:hypothetical protein
MTPFVFFPLTIAAAVILAWLGLWYFWQSYNTHKLLHLYLDIDNPKVARAECLRFKIKIFAAKDVKVLKIITKIRCVQREFPENSSDFSGSSRIAPFLLLLNTLFEKSPVPLNIVEEYVGEVSRENFFFRQAVPQEFEGEFPIPGDALHTKDYGVLRTYWYLIVEAVLPFGPPASLSQEFYVVEKSVEAPQVTGDASQLFLPRSSSHPRHSSGNPFSNLEIKEQGNESKK